MHYVYLLYSEKLNRYYVGSTGNLDQRLRSHNNKGSQSTQHGVPWELVYYEAYEYRRDALRREYRLKHHGKGIAEVKKRLSVRR